MQHKAQSRF